MAASAATRKRTGQAVAGPPPARHYTYSVEWSEEDQEFVGTALEFPSLSWLEAEPDKALAGIIQTVAEVLELMVEDGEQPPLPFNERAYSGKFQLRVPPRLHRELAKAAAREHVSINQYVVARLEAGTAAKTH